MDDDYLIVPSGPPESFCRLCLSESNIEPLLVIQDGFLQPNQGLVDLIKRYVEIGLSPSMDGPCGVCSACRMMLEEFERFRERCLRCDYVLTGKERSAPFECSECPSRFRFKVEFERHWKSNHDMFYRCDSCEAGFSTQAMLDGHWNQFHKDGSSVSFNCSFCPRIFTDENQLQFHVQLLHSLEAPPPVAVEVAPPPPVVAEIVAPPPAKKRKPARNRRIDPKQFHKNPDNPDRPYECRVCRIRFSFIGSLTRHLAEKHKSPMRPANKKNPSTAALEVLPTPVVAEETLMPAMAVDESCPVVPIAISVTDQNIADMSNHYSVPNEPEPIFHQYPIKQEPLPPGTYPFVIALTRLDPDLIPPIANYEIPVGKFYHALQRQAEAPFEESAMMDDEIMMNYPSFTRRVETMVRCEICLAEVSNKRTLDRHMATFHQVGKTYTCEICKAGFMDKRNYDRHVATKHEGNFYTCPECFRQFYDKSSLDRHSYQHSNEFPFVCDECPLGFVRLGLMQKHKGKYHYPGAPKLELFYCPYCSRPFISKQQLKNHVMFLHSGQCEDMHSLLLASNAAQ